MGPHDLVVKRLALYINLNKNIVRLEIGHNLAESHRLNLGEKLSITCQKTLTIYLKLKKPIR